MSGVEFAGYRVLGEVARGGMGVVYRVQDASGRVFALKVLLERDPGLVERFKREAKLASGLAHPNVVRVHAYGVTQGRPYLVMDYVEGEDLMARVLRDGPLPEVEARRLFGLLGEGLQAAHAQGVVHRDLKPQNVLLKGAEVYLADFGLARQGTSALTATGELVGTPAYMAPEQATGERDGTGPAADVYGFGATLYAALCGAPPFRGGSLFETLDKVLNSEPPPLRGAREGDLSRGLERLVMECLRKDPRERPSLDDVLARLGSGPASAARSPGLLLAAGALGLAGLALGVGLSAGAPAASPSPSPAQSVATRPPATPVESPTPEHGAQAAAALAEARARLERRQLPQARRGLERVLELEPENHEARLLLGICAFWSGDWETAERVPERLAGAGPELLAEACYYRGRALIRHWRDSPPSSKVPRLAQAREALEQSDGLETSARTKAWLGMAHLYLGERGRAAELLPEAKRLMDADTAAHVFVLAHALKPSPMTATTYVPLAKGSLESDLILATYRFQRGEDDQAEALLSHAKSLRPGEEVSILACRATALIARERRGTPRGRQLVKILSLLQAALELAPRGTRAEVELLASRIEVLTRLERLPETERALPGLEPLTEAERDLRRLVELDPSRRHRVGLAQFLLDRVANDLSTWELEVLARLLADAKEVIPDDHRDLHAIHLALSGRLRAMAADFRGAEELFAASAAAQGLRGRPLAELPQGPRGRAVRYYIQRGMSRTEAVILGQPGPLGSPDLQRAAEVERAPFVRTFLARALWVEGQREEAEAVLAGLRKDLRPDPRAYRLAEGLIKSDPHLIAGVEPNNPYYLAAGFGKVSGLEKRLEEVPREIRAHPVLNLALARHGRSGGRFSLALLDKMLERHPGSSELRFERGLARAMGGKHEEALEDLERARRDHPLAYRKQEIAAEIERVEALRDAK